LELIKLAGRWTHATKFSGGGKLENFYAWLQGNV
jgi:hypothetical protein